MDDLINPILWGRNPSNLPKVILAMSPNVTTFTIYSDLVIFFLG